MTNLHEQVRRDIGAHKLLRSGESVLVAVSGGVDSMVLLHLLKALSVEEGWHLVVAHLNHCLRGRSSDADERLVHRIASKLRLPVISARVGVKDISLKNRISVEMAGRAARHEFLAKAASRKRIRSIALAHHADDQLELFFIRLFRGTGTDALAGMKWASRSPADGRIRIVRPLLGQTKTTLVEFATSNQIEFREDASNQSLDMARNRIRHELLPLLKEHYQPALAERILRLMEIIRAESSFIGEIAKGWLDRNARRKSRIVELACGLPGAFDHLPEAVQRRCIHLQLIQLGVTPDFELIEVLRRSELQAVEARIKANRNLAADLNSSRDLVREKTGRIVFQPRKSNRFRKETRVIDLETRDQASFGGRAFRWRFRAKSGLIGMKKRGQAELFDADLVGKRVILRHWRPGDRFQPIGMGSAAKLQDLFVNQKVPADQRRTLVLATTETDEIFWVEGLRISDHYKLTGKTRLRLEWRWEAH